MPRVSTLRRDSSWLSGIPVSAENASQRPGRDQGQVLARALGGLGHEVAVADRTLAGQHVDRVNPSGSCDSTGEIEIRSTTPPSA